MKYRPVSTECSTEGCSNTRRPGGRLCRECHAERQKLRRAEEKELRGQGPGLLADELRKAKRRALLIAVREERGNLGRAAVRLGVHRNTVSRILAELGISTPLLLEYVRASQMEEIDRRRVA